MSFTVYPAIDLKDGRCVRLRQGDLDAVTVYADDPAAQAQAFERAGFTALHLVDLNGAVEGRSVNAQAVERVLAAVRVPVQLGGGIRTMPQIEAWLGRGVSRVILGTAAVANPDLLREAARAFPGRIVVGIDARDGMVAVAGWTETSARPAAEIARLAEESGAAAIIYTDIARDGMLSGVNVAATAALAASLRMPVIASGGLSGLADIDALLASRRRTPNVAGVIAGRALYDGRLSAADALARASGAG